MVRYLKPVANLISPSLPIVVGKDENLQRSGVVR